MAALTDALTQAGLRPVGWLGEADLAAIVRQAFEPSVEIDPTSDPAANLSHAGPVAVSESWQRLRHDSAWSSVLWVSEWPRIAVPPDFLHPLVFAPGVRRTLSITSRPQPTDAALRQIRREKTEAVADSAQKARFGQLADLSDSQEYDDLMARERSVISGHTDVEFTGLLTVTTTTAEALDAGGRHDHADCRAGELRGPAALRTSDAGLHRGGPASRTDNVLMGARASRESRRRRDRTEERQDGEQPKYSPRLSACVESDTRVYGAVGWSPPRSGPRSTTVGSSGGTRVSQETPRPTQGRDGSAPPGAARTAVPARWW